MTENVERIRQFVQEETGTVVTCGWSFDHAAWVCDADRDPQFTRCCTEITPLYEELLEAGYRELEAPT